MNKSQINETKKIINNKIENAQNQGDTLILGIESSCDETAASIVANGRVVLSNVIASQIDIHQQYGGVVPEIASREHLKAIVPVIDKALNDASLSLADIDGIAVTYGPGLVGALLVGLSAAKGIAMGANKPLIGVNHILGHIAANYLTHEELTPPFVCLVASGGHSHIVKVEDYNKQSVIGRTRDDAVGEAFDKVSRYLGLGYPGGPAIQLTAENGRPDAIAFPRVHFKDEIYDFSFSGLKTAVINYVNHNRQKQEDYSDADVAASFQQAAVDVLVQNTINAAKDVGINKIVLAGGVSANLCLRQTMTECGHLHGIEVYTPKIGLCTDNAAMIASAGYFEFINNKLSDMSLNAVPGLKLEKMC